MKIEEIIKKLQEGKELTEAEKEFLKNYDFSEAARIPKSRLDQEIEKRKAAEAQAASLQAKMDELSAKIEELEGKGLSEAEKAKKETEKVVSGLKKELEKLTKERDDAAASLKAIERKAKVKEIADKHNFSDSDYLDYLASSKQINIEDEAATMAFVRELEQKSPELFRSTAKPGGGTKGAGDQQGGAPPDAEKRIKELLAKPELTSREAGEVIKLQESLNSKNQGGSAGGGGASQ
jgi:chromosome segregation ATPase